MTTKNRILTQYHIELKLYKGRKIRKNWTLENELINVFEYLINLNIVDRKHDDKYSNKIYFLESYTYIDNIFDLAFKSAKYNHVRNVIDTNTLTNRGRLKNKEDGDEEKTHFSIYIEDDNSGVCLLENNYLGISASKIESYLNSKIVEYYTSIDKLKFYKVEISIIPNKDFIKALSEVQTISATSLIVDKNEIGGSDFLGVSKLNDVRDEIEIKLKRTKIKGINKKTVKEYYESKEKKGTLIKRILVSARANNNTIQLDTERMKTKNTIKVEVEADTGEVKSISIFKEFRKILLGDEEGES